LWAQTNEREQETVTPIVASDIEEAKKDMKLANKSKAYNEEIHISGKPQEVIDIYKAVDKFCRELDSKNVQRIFQAKTVNYLINKKIFCSVHLTKNGLRIWAKLIYSQLDNPLENVRDVSNVGY